MFSFTATPLPSSKYPVPGTPPGYLRPHLAVRTAMVEVVLLLSNICCIDNSNFSGEILIPIIFSGSIVAVMCGLPSATDPMI